MLAHGQLKHLQALRDDETLREREGVFIVEGEKAVEEFIASKKFSFSLYALESWSHPSCSPREITLLSANEMQRISHLPSPSSVLAVVQIPKQNELSSADIASGLTLALDDIQDPGNLGTIIRIADWFGFQRVLCSQGCARTYSQKVVNATKGSLSRVPVFRQNLPLVLKNCTASIFGAALEGASIHDVSFPKDAVIVIGNEGRGISAPVKQLCSGLVSIPRFGAAESLNAAVAAGILCSAIRK